MRNGPRGHISRCTLLEGTVDALSLPPPFLLTPNSTALPLVHLKIHPRRATLSNFSTLRQVGCPPIKLLPTSNFARSKPRAMLPS